MKTDSYVLLAIFLGFLVSWIPRVAPFILVKYKGLPPIVIRFLKYLPISILFALTFSSFLNIKTGRLPVLKSWEILASIPTFYIGFKSKNLFYTVITGVLAMALLRFFF